MQYNYSAENDGAGYLVYDFGAAPFRLADNVVRFNVSENDGRKNGYAAISVNSAGTAVERLCVLHNTVFVGPSEAKERPSALFVGKSKDCRVHNNLLITTGGCALADIGADTSGLRIEGDHYWAAESPFRVRHSGAEFRSLSAWRERAGVEQLDGKEVGSTGDPLLRGRVPGTPLTEANNRTSLERFKLRSDSPLAGAGLDLKKMFAIDAGDRDYWGNTLARSQPAAVGAHSGRDR
jgi:hypothetical protein